MYGFTYVHVHLCALVHGGQRPTSSVLLECSSLYFWQQGLSLNLDFPDWLDFCLYSKRQPPVVRLQTQKLSICIL